MFPVSLEVLTTHSTYIPVLQKERMTLAFVLLSENDFARCTEGNRYDNGGMFFAIIVRCKSNCPVGIKIGHTSGELDPKGGGQAARYLVDDVWHWRTVRRRCPIVRVRCSHSGYQSSGLVSFAKDNRLRRSPLDRVCDFLVGGKWMEFGKLKCGLSTEIDETSLAGSHGCVVVYTIGA